MAADGSSWRTQALRRSVVAKIEEAIRRSGIPTAQNSIEMENHVFQKAKSKEEYLNVVARIILPLRQITPRRGNAGAAQRMPDPIGALQTSARQSTGNYQMMGMNGPVPRPQGMVQPLSSNSSISYFSQAPPLLTNLPEDNVEHDTQCSVCRSAQSCFLCIPCFHMVLCGQCANQIIYTSRNYADGTNPMFGQLRCPLCNQDVSEFKRVYMPAA